MTVVHPYILKRQQEIDYTEYVDILFGLKALKVELNDKIIELGAGSGGLIKFLKAQGYRNVIGIDLLYSSQDVMLWDLEKNMPPKADAYVFQHVLEHLDQNRAKELLKYCYEVAGKVVGILPAHYVEDPTHMVNHYTKRDIYDLIDYVQPKFFVLTPDMWSYVVPDDLDYLLIMGEDYIRKFRPHWFSWLRYPLWLYMMRLKGRLENEQA